MKSGYQRKYFSLKALDVDTTKRRVKIAIAETETKDYDGDIIIPSAFTKSIKERGPKGTNEVWHLLDHDRSSFSALSKPTELGMEKSYLTMVSPYRDTFAWREVAWPLYEAGDFTQHSVGMEVIRQEKRRDYNEIQEVVLMEGSTVLWGANPNTPTMGVQKGRSLEDQKEDIHKRLNRIITAVNKHVYGDDNSLLIIELKQLQAWYDDLKETTPPVEKTTEPENRKLSAEIVKQIGDLSLMFK